MKSIEVWRDSFRQAAARAGGTSVHDDQRYAAGVIARAAGMPQIKWDVKKPSFFQCLDPSSVNYGKRVFIAGLDPVGSPEFLIGEDCG